MPGQRDPETGACSFCPGRTQPQTKVWRDFTDNRCDTHGIEPTCTVSQITPSNYRRYVARQRKHQLRSAHVKTDDTWMPQIQLVWQPNMQVLGSNKVWHQMNRESIKVVRCTAERFIKRMGLPLSPRAQ